MEQAACPLLGINTGVVAGGGEADMQCGKGGHTRFGEVLERSRYRIILQYT